MERTDLLRRLARLLGPDSLERVEADLDALEHNGRLPDWLTHLVDAASALPLPEVPPVVTQDLRLLFERDALVEEQRAVLVNDSRERRDLVGVRGAATANDWSMSYTSETADIVLDVRPRRDGAVTLEGQVMAHGGAESAYRAAATGPTPESVDGDRLGRFRFDALEPGRYTIAVDNGRVKLFLEADLGEPLA